MYTINNEAIGKYLKKLIDQHYSSTRQFCIDYLKKENIDPTNDEIRKKSNKFSQIIQGKKGIQLTDLPVISELLDISCEELLSAGQVLVPTSNHITNYVMANSLDENEWKAYLNREDKLFLNSDEHNKTILDYIFEFKNYKFLYYLLEHEIITLTDDNKWGTSTYSVTTKIQRRKLEDTDKALFEEIRYQDRIRTNSIALAIENNDYKVLELLKARENPGLRNMVFHFAGYHKDNYYNEYFINAIANSDKRILNYFSEEFIVAGVNEHQNEYIFPYIGEVIDVMLNNNNSMVELLIQPTLKHNKKVYEKLHHLYNKYYSLLEKEIDIELNDELKEMLSDKTLNIFWMSKEKQMVSCVLYYEDIYEFYLSNFIKIDNKSNNDRLNKLIDESNKYYNKICEQIEERYTRFY